MEYDNTNTGLLSRNERKTEVTHADHRGTLNVEGVEYWIDGYVKERKDGSGKFFSLRVKRKEAAKASVKAAPTPQSNGLDDWSDIPFITASFGMDMQPGTERRMRKYHY